MKAVSGQVDSSDLAAPLRLAVDSDQSFACMAAYAPQDLAKLGVAFDGAVVIASDEVGPYAVLPAHELRRRLASAILNAAREGVRDIGLMRAHALRSVAAGLQSTLLAGATTHELPDDMLHVQE